MCVCLQVGLGDVSMGLAGLTWDKLVDPHKVAIWWQPGPGEGLDSLFSGAGQIGGGNQIARPDSKVGGELMKLAAEQRMNTEVRRRIFCVVMGASPYKLVVGQWNVALVCWCCTL